MNPQFSLDMTPAQRTSFDTFATLLLASGKSKEEQPKIFMTPDEEICISRKTKQGISNLLIFKDGMLAHSFIAYKNNDRKDFLRFVDSEKIGDLLIEVPES